MALSKPPSDSALKTLEDFMSDVFLRRYKKEISILTTGKFGVGKSTLVNTLVGRPVAEEADRYKEKGDTSETKQCFAEVINGVKIQIWDTAGLQDGTDNDDLYLADIQEKTKGKIDLVLCCLKMDDTRFHAADKNVIKKLTDFFGKELWEHTVVALTFANKVEPAKFVKELKTWQEIIHLFFKKELNIGPELLQSMPIVPTGYHQPPSPSQHPSQSEWLKIFWCACFNFTRNSAAFNLVRLKRIVSSNGEPICNVGPTHEPTKDGENIKLDDEDEDAFWKRTWEIIKEYCSGPVGSVILGLISTLGYTAFKMVLK